MSSCSASSPVQPPLGGRPLEIGRALGRRRLDMLEDRHRDGAVAVAPADAAHADGIAALRKRARPLTGKRMHWPELAVSSTSSLSVQVSTPRIASPSSSSFMAILPLRLTWTKSDSLLRRTVPRVVANMTSRSVPLGLVLRQRQDRGDAVALLQRQHVAQGLAARLRVADRQAPDLFLVDDAARGEEQHRRMRVGDEQPGDEILVLGRHAGAALAAAALRPVERQRHALDVAGVA